MKGKSIDANEPLDGGTPAHVKASFNQQSASALPNEPPSGTERWKVRVRPRREQRRLDGIFFSPDGTLLVTTGHEAQTTEVWEAATGRSVAMLDIGRCRGVAFHPDEPVLAVAGGGTIYVVELPTGKILRSLPNAHAGDGIFAIAFSGDGPRKNAASERTASGTRTRRAPGTRASRSVRRSGPCRNGSRSRQRCR